MNKKILLASAIALAFSGSLMANAKVLNANNPEKYQEYRLDIAEMQDLANPNKLAFRTFYEEPSKGPHKEWFDAVKKGDIELVKQMIADGQNIEATDEASAGQTALGWAAFIGYEDIVDLLLENNANLLAPDRGDVTDALKSAALGKNLNVFKKIYNLMKNDIKINDQTKDKQGETMLIAAAGNNRLEIVEFLLKEGADPNIATTKDAWWSHHPAFDTNALSYACKSGLTEMSELLIKHGAVNHTDGKAECEAK